jgi:hypothetical protein
MSDPSITSYLSPLGETTTPNEVLALARRVCLQIRRKVLGRKVQAHLWSDEGEGASSGRSRQVALLMLSLVDEHGSYRILQMAMVGSYRFTVADSDLSYILTVLPVPDFAEALHFLGIVMEGMGVAACQIGRQADELNRDLLALPLASGEITGALDLCLGAQRRTHDPDSDERRGCAVGTSSTYTSVETFNWTILAVARLRRRLPGSCIQASIRSHRELGRRDWQACSRGYSQMFDRQGISSDRLVEKKVVEEWLVLDLADESGAEYSISFHAGSPSYYTPDQSLILVPSLIEGLHIVGMILEALGVARCGAGSRNHERNEEALIRPLQRGQDCGQMVNVTNFVPPLEVVVM